MTDTKQLPLKGQVRCLHKMKQFSKVPGSQLATMRCVECGHQETISLNRAFEQMLEVEGNNVFADR